VIENNDCERIAIDSKSVPMETSYRQDVVQSVHDQALVRPGLPGCLKTCTLAICRCLSISFPAALRQERHIAESDARVARRQINSFSVNIPHLNQTVRLRTSGLHEYSKETVQHGNDTGSNGGWDMDGE